MSWTSTRRRTGEEPSDRLALGVYLLETVRGNAHDADKIVPRQHWWQVSSEGSSQGEPLNGPMSGRPDWDLTEQLRR